MASENPTFAGFHRKITELNGGFSGQLHLITRGHSPAHLGILGFITNVYKLMHSLCNIVEDITRIKIPIQLGTDPTLEP